MGGIRGHSLFENLLPLGLVFLVALFALRDRPNGWLLALTIPAAIGVIALVLTVIQEVRRRFRNADLIMLRDYANEGSEKSLREAERIAARVLKADPLKYRSLLDGMTSFLEAAKKEGRGAQLCRQVLFRHAPWSEEMEREIAALRYRLEPGQHAAWLEWFLTARMGWHEFEDRLADVTMYALHHMDAAQRQAYLVRVLGKVRKRESWRRFGQKYAQELHALDREQLSSHQREMLEFLQGDGAIAS